MPEEPRTTAHNAWHGIFKYSGYYLLLFLLCIAFNIPAGLLLALPVLVALPAFIISGIALIIIKQAIDERNGRR